MISLFFCGPRVLSREKMAARLCDTYLKIQQAGPNIF